jgi:cell division protein FtsQ
MNISNNTKKWLNMGKWISLSLVIVIVLVAAIQKNKNQTCKNIEVTIIGKTDQIFINEKNILQLTEASSIINKKTVDEVDLKTLETKLEKNIWIDNVELYFDKNAVLHIDVIERTPLMRVFKQNGNSFYFDSKNLVLPLSNDYSAKVPVFTGFANNATFTPKDSSLLEPMNVLASYIINDEFWMAQVQQINIVNDNQFELIPTIGNHTILFGDTSNMKNKFDRLFKFYKTVSSKIGFDKYHILNVKFNNQIVATNDNGKAIDSVTARNAIQDFIRNSTDSSLHGIALDTTRIVDTTTTKPVDTVRKVPTNTSIQTVRGNANQQQPRAIMPKRPATTTPIRTTVAPRPKPPTRSMPKPPKPPVRRNNNVHNN